MRRRTEVDDEKYVPPRAMLILLGTWTVVMLFLALIVVPILFAPCTANIPPQP